MKVLAIIQARMGSTRLPGKTMFNLGGKPLLERVIDRVCQSSQIDQVLVATTIEKQDQAVVKLCLEKNIETYAGSVNDVLDRFYQAAKDKTPENVVRITADCPLMDYQVIDKVIAEHLASDADYTSNVLEESYPDGEDIEIFKFSALKEAAQKATLLSEREHVTLYIRNHPEKFKLVNVKNDQDLSSKRWTIDNREDYEFIRKIYAGLQAKPYFGMQEILEYLKQHPELEKINNHIERNEGLRKSIAEDESK